MTDQFKVTEFRDDMHQKMLEQLRFNRFDMKFMTNIHVRYIAERKPLSPGQNDLYEKLVHKYRKQFKKLGANYKDIIKTTWQQGIVSEEKLKQQTLFKIEDNIMILTFNFNKKLIDEVRALVHDDNAEYLKRGSTDDWGTNSHKYEFTWNSDTKIWSGPFNTYLFRSLYYFAAKHGIRMDDSVNELHRSYTLQFDTARTFTPHLHILNDTMYVSQITESMMPYLDGVDMSDLSITNIESLTKLGLHAPSELGEITRYVSAYSPSTKHELHNVADVNVLKDYVKQSKRKIILYMPQSVMVGQVADSEHTMALGLDKWDSEVIRYHESGTTDLDMLLEVGYNTLITTMPVDDLLRSQKQIGTFATVADKVIYISIAGKT